jgi:hypothetical protein
MEFILWPFESKLPPHQGTGGVSRGTTLVSRACDSLSPTAYLRSVPRLTLGLRSALLVLDTFTRKAPEGTSLDFHLGGVSVYAPCLPVGCIPATFLDHSLCRLFPIICKYGVLSSLQQLWLSPTVSELYESKTFIDLRFLPAGFEFELRV